MKLNTKRTIFIGLAFMSISAFWQLYDQIIPLMLERSFGLSATVIGSIMSLDNILALFMLPIFGTLSDKVNTRLGKRTPFIVVGTIGAVIFLIMIPIAAEMKSLGTVAVPAPAPYWVGHWNWALGWRSPGNSPGGRS